MDFESPDVERDFPGLYASEGTSKKKEESEFSEGDHERVSKKDLLIGRRKDKKDKKDLKYATLDGESSPEEDLEAKSPSKSKKSKAFKFTTSKSKEKREKSREKDKLEKDVKDISEGRDKEKKKDKKEKDKKEKLKDKEKDKKDKKSKISEEVLELGDVQPVFGVSVSLATERSCCHDGIDLPLVVRDCIDYLQENGLQNEQIYKVEPVKRKLLFFKRLYNNRETQGISEDFDVPTACGLLKLFLKELPEPILTTDLIPCFEEAASDEKELYNLLNQLPGCNQTLLGWILLHFNSVIRNEKLNRLNAQNLAVLFCPPLQMSHRLLVALLCHCKNLFPNVELIKYIPPITASSPKLPETPDDIQKELRKQESLLEQIHTEMNAGFVSKKREEQLWEVQRIITQLKRKLRLFEKRQERYTEDVVDGDSSGMALELNENLSEQHIKMKLGYDNKFIKAEKVISATDSENKELTIVPEVEKLTDSNPDNMYLHKSGLLMVPESHPDYLTLIRLQLLNQELLQWKQQLQAKINAERTEILRFKKLYAATEQQSTTCKTNNFEETGDYEKIIEHYLKENNLLEYKKNMLAHEIFEEKKELIQYQVDLALHSFEA